jgi:GNAT superfamily N-acetyltransferase
MKFFVREALSKDAEDIARLSNQLGYAISASATLQNLETISKNQREIILVAVHEEKCVGWIHVFYTTRLESGSFCEIGGLVVDDQYRGMGIGKLLTEHSKSWCINMGVFSLRVRSNIKRKEAHEFYSQLGFSENKQQKLFEMNLAEGN